MVNIFMMGRVLHDTNDSTAKIQQYAKIHNDWLIVMQAKKSHYKIRKVSLKFCSYTIIDNLKYE